MGRTRLARTVSVNVAIAALFASGLTVAAAPPANAAATKVTERVSVATGGGQADQGTDPSVSGNGRYVAFRGNFNGADDGPVYLRDRLLGTTTPVSIDGSGHPQAAELDTISRDGRYVAFQVVGTSFLPGVTYANAHEVYVRDVVAGTTTRASVDNTGAVPAFSTVNNNPPAISDNGRYVAFGSSAPYVAGDSNGDHDVFVRDRTAGTTERVSVTGAGGQLDALSDGFAMSGDGRYVAFRSDATNLPGATLGTPGMYVRDRQAGTTTRIADAYGSPSISGDGRFVSFYTLAALVPADTNPNPDIYVYDRNDQSFDLVTADLTGAASGQVDQPLAISDDGNLVAFRSVAGNLVTGDTNGIDDTFVRDRAAGTTERVDVTAAGAQVTQPQGGWEGSTPLGLSADGSTVVFTSSAPSLVPGDTNQSSDVFVRTTRFAAGPAVTITSPGDNGSYVVGQSVTADYSCADVGGFGLVSCVGTVPDGAAVSTSTAGVKSFTVTGTAAGSKTTVKTVSYTVYEVLATATLSGGGGVVTTDPTNVGPTGAVPVATTVTSPNDGFVSIGEGPKTTATPLGFTVVSKQVNIVAPAASAGAPLTFQFDLDHTLVPSGETKDTLSVLKDGALLVDCPGETTLPIDVHACVTARADAPSGGGDIRLTVISDSASRWNIASGSPVAPVVQTVASATVIEGNSGTRAVTIPVTLSAPSALPVSVHYATGTGSATASTDYVATSGTLSFAPGETIKFIVVTVKGDTASETDETVPVVISAPSGATLGVSVATLKIFDDDHFSVITSSLPAASVGHAYSTSIAVVGGTAPYKWKRVGKLPKKLKLAPKTGVITGIPTTAGTYGFSVTVTDKAKPKHSITRALSITVH